MRCDAFRPILHRLCALLHEEPQNAAEYAHFIVTVGLGTVAGMHS